MKTGTIRYSVRERGRKYRGQARNFDTAALATLINGNEVQERVRNRDLVGYFGHWPRIVFGMNPGEGGMHNGKPVAVEAAVTTTYLAADEAGNIDHITEFLDTAPGRTARRLAGSRSGGYSSAINCHPFGGKDVPLGFYGFDYVMEPNFTTNRGYALDGVFDDVGDGGEAAGGIALDSVISDSQAMIKVLDGINTALQGDFDRLVAVVARQQAEIEEMATMIAKRGPAAVVEAKTVLARLDSAYSRQVVGARPSGSSQLERMAAEFTTMPLAETERIEDPASARVAKQLRGILTAGVRGLGR